MPIAKNPNGARTDAERRAQNKREQANRVTLGVRVGKADGEAFRAWCAARGITVNAIAPGFIDTEMTAVLPDDVKKAMGEQIPLKRFGTTEDVAQAAVFLASDRAAYITGQVLCVDGGMAM